MEFTVGEFLKVDSKSFLEQEGLEILAFGPAIYATSELRHVLVGGNPGNGEPLKRLNSRFHGNDKMMNILTFYESVKGSEFFNLSLVICTLKHISIVMSA